MKPEQEVEIKLWDWFKTKGEFIDEVYFNNTKNLLNWKSFKVKGSRKKPDLILKIDLGYGKEYIAVEVKDCSDSKNVLDAQKILDSYYIDYIKGITKYFIADEEIKLNYFVVATQSSLRGYLYDNEDFVYAKDSKNKSKRYVANMGLIPNREGIMTHQYVRTMWNYSNRIFDLIKPLEKPGLGIIISDEDGKPYMMVKKWIDYLNKKPQWSQRWIKL